MKEDTWILVVLLAFYVGSSVGGFYLGRRMERKSLIPAFVEATKQTYLDGYFDGKRAHE